MINLSRRFTSVLMLCILPLCTELAAQTPAKTATEIFSGQLSRESYNAIQTKLIAQALDRSLGVQLTRQLTPPPLAIQQLYRKGKPIVILPKKDLVRQIDYFTNQQVPLERINKYVHGLQKHFDNRENFFEILARTYYNRHFTVLTPNIDDLIIHISYLQNPALEARFLKRLKQLTEYRPKIAQEFPNIDPKHNMRVRYINDIDNLTPENFDETKLVLAIEQFLRPSTKRTLYRHIRGNSTFTIGKNKEFRVYNYNGPTEYIPNLYRYLVNGNDALIGMTLVLDTARNSLLLYNYDKTIWLRVTPHEYKDPDHLHVHVHKLIKQGIIVNKREHYEPVLLNLSIAIKRPNDIPLDEENLYKAFIDRPFKQLQSTPQIQVITK